MFFESEDNPLKPGGGSLSSTADPFGINRRRRPSLLDLDLPPTENNRGLLWDPADGFAKGPQPSQAFGPPKLPTLTGLDDDNDPNQTAGGLNRGGDPGRGDAALTQLASPFGPSDGADPWAAGSMADVLLRKDDYADAATHYQGQAKTDPAGTRAELSAIHDRMASADPASAAKFVTQMSAAGLTAAKTEPPAEVGLTPLWIDIYNTHQEDDSFDPKDSDTIEVADASERTNAPFVAKATRTKSFSAPRPMAGGCRPAATPPSMAARNALPWSKPSFPRLARPRTGTVVKTSRVMVTRRSSPAPLSPAAGMPRAATTARAEAIMRRSS